MGDWPNQAAAANGLLSGSPWVNARDPAYGAEGDGIADDAPAIQAAINAVKGALSDGSQGGLVLLPKGTYLIKNQLIVPKKVTLRGAGRGASLVSADGSFPTNTALIKLGDGSGSPAWAGGARVEDIGVLCNGVAGSVGVYSEEVQEAGGCVRVQVVDYGDAGMRFIDGTATPQNFILEDCHVSGTALQNINNVTYPNAAGYDLNCSGSFILLLRCTAAASNATSAPARGFNLRGVNGDNMVACHSEGFADGVQVKAGSVQINGYQGHTNQTNQIRIDAGFTGSFVGMNLRVGGSSSTPLILDEKNGLVCPGTASCALYVIGATGATRSVLTTEALLRIGNATVAVSGFSVSGSGPYAVTLATASPHGLSIGQTVTVAGIVSTGTAPNGSAVVIAVADTTHFAISVASDPGTYTSGGTANGPTNKGWERSVAPQSFLAAIALARRAAAVTSVTTLDAATEGVVPVDATAAPITVTLPATAATQPGQLVILKKIEGGANAVTVTAAGSDTIDGAATYSLTGGARHAVILVSTGGSPSGRWDIMGAY